MSTVLEISQDSSPSSDYVAEIRNQSVPDPTPSEIRERSAEIRQDWSETRWRKERRRFRNRAWTVPEVRVAPALTEGH